MTAIGLEVEGMETYGIDPQQLAALIVGQVITCEKHPNADNLSLTTIDTGTKESLQIVCGAKNVAVGQKVVVATIGTLLHPIDGEPFTIKKAKIRGIESFGMLCAADEIGLSHNHEGILTLPTDARIGDSVSNYFDGKQDVIMEIGLTPNRTDAMSHRGVARDICAYLSYHERKNIAPLLPALSSIPTGSSPITVSIEDEKACMRYSGVLIENITVQESPNWLKERLESIGQKPINNIVDLTNFILFETGQPLHAFDADKISGNAIHIKTLPAGTPFITLDEKEHKLTATDLMICDAEKPLCIAGVYGGRESGVTQKTTRLFIESAFFSSSSIRKTSIYHQLRTDAASRFEKGTDISETKSVLQRAIHLILEITEGKVVGGITDIYPTPLEKKKITLTQSYLHRISGKEYQPDAVGGLLQNLGYEVTTTPTGWNTLIPYNKPGTKLAAEIVQDIMRIDGLDNIPIPQHITITPEINRNKKQFKLRSKVINMLVGSGWNEIFTNSLTNGRWYPEQEKENRVVMMNSLSIELDTLRPNMLLTGLNTIAHNLNRKNQNLSLFEMGKTYKRNENEFSESPRLALYTCGMSNNGDWKNKPQQVDLYFLKGTLDNLFQYAGLSAHYSPAEDALLDDALTIMVGEKIIGKMGKVKSTILKINDIKTSVYYADLLWTAIEESSNNLITYQEISKYPIVHRDLSLVVDKQVVYADIEQATHKAGIKKLNAIELFDIFENEKLGTNKKSMAISFTFTDDTRTLTDEEIEKMVQQLISVYEKELKAEIRKQ